jgi:hypothetical protein
MCVHSLSVIKNIAGDKTAILADWQDRPIGKTDRKDRSEKPGLRGRSSRSLELAPP